MILSFQSWICHFLALIVEMHRCIRCIYITAHPLVKIRSSHLQFIGLHSVMIWLNGVFQCKYTIHGHCRSILNYLTCLRNRKNCETCRDNSRLFRTEYKYVINFPTMFRYCFYLSVKIDGNKYKTFYFW